MPSSSTDNPARPARRRSWRWKAAALVTGLVLALLIAEVAARMFDLTAPVYAPRRIEPATGVPFMLDRSGLRVYAPNATFSNVFDPAGDHRDYFGPGGRVTYRINQFGMRGPAVPIAKRPGEFRVACLGDSFTFGQGVHLPDTYPARLEALLAHAPGGRSVTVLNAGVQAFNTLESIVFYRDHVARFKPDLVLLGFVLNDATDTALTVSHDESLAREPELSRLAEYSRLWESWERRRRASRIQAEFLETTRASFDSENWDHCKTALAAMRQAAEETGFRFVVVIFPVFWKLDGDYPFEGIHKLIRDAVEQEGGEVIDLLEAYRGMEATSLWVHPTDQHPNEIAHRIAAEQIHRYLKQAQ